MCQYFHAKFCDKGSSTCISVQYRALQQGPPLMQQLPVNIEILAEL